MNASENDHWSAPHNADPSAILDEAVDDTRKGHHPRALAKFMWFFANSKAPGSGLGGVRLSFALSYWHELALQFPAAMTELENTRNRAADNVISGDSVFESFHEVSALNQTLGDDRATLKLFLHLDACNPEFAKETYDLAESVLVQHKRFDICNRYLDANATIDHAIHLLELSRDSPYPALTSDEHRRFAEDNFRRMAGTVVALLVIAERTDEAREIADRVYAAWDDTTVRDTIEQAMSGSVPQGNGA